MTTRHATTLVDLGRHAEALQALDALGDAGLTADAYCLRARAYLGLRRWKDAEAAAAAARAADPAQEWGYRLGAIVARRQMRPKDAHALAEQAVRLAPYEPNTHQVATLTAIDLGHRDVALAHAEELVRLSPNDATAHYTHGLALAANGCAAPAEAAIRRALAIDPEHDGAMAALADIVGARDAAGATQLRLSALRTAPQQSSHRKRMLLRGGAAGGVLAVGKFGLLGKLFLTGSAVRAIANGSGVNRGVIAAVLLLVYVATFAVSRVRRHRHGKTLPPLVWEGLKAERRNADLLWAAVPASLALVIAVLGFVIEVARGHSPLHPGIYAAASAALVALCWRARRGDARDLRPRDVAQRVVGVLRFLWQRTSARRRRPALDVQSRRGGA